MLFSRIGRYIHHRYRAVVIAISLSFLLANGVYLLFFFNHPSCSQAEDVSDRIGNNYAQAASLCHQWLDAEDDSLFLEKIWELGITDYWTQQQLSLFLFDNDSMVYWGYNPYLGNIEAHLLEPSNHTLDTLSDRQVLIFRFVEDRKSATLVIQLQDLERSEFNSAIFKSNKIELLSACKFAAPSPDLVEVDQSRFYIKPLLIRTVPNVLLVLWWLGVLLLLMALKSWVRNITTRSNVFKIATLFFWVLLFLRVVIFIVPSAYQHVYMFEHTLGPGIPLFNSLGDMMITFAMAFIYILYLYRVRSKFLWHYRKLSKPMQLLTFTLLLIFLNMVVVFYHFAVMSIIYDSQIEVELYDVFNVNASSLIFYLIGSIVVAIRVIGNKLVDVNFVNYPFAFRMTASVLILALMTIPLEGQIRNTGYLLLLFHTLFILSSHISRKKLNEYGVFLTSIFVFALYTTFFTSVETYTANESMAKEYMHTLEADTTCVEVAHNPKFTYAIIDSGVIHTQSSNSIDLQSIFPIIDMNVDTIVTSERYIHLIDHPSSSRIIVVSYVKTSIIDYIALFSYIYILMFCVCLLILSLVGYDSGMGLGWSRMAIKIRLALAGIVLLALILLAVVIVSQSMDNLRKQNIITAGNSIKNMTSSFDKFISNHPKSLDPLSQWPLDLGSSMSRYINTYDTLGNLVYHSSRNMPTSKMDNVAYHNLRWLKAPYFILTSETQAGNQYLSSFNPIIHKGKLYGYMNIIDGDQLQNDARKATITSTLNVFIIVLLLILAFSLLIYQQITKPLSRLNLGLQNIAHMKKIAIREDVSPYDEVEVLIVQYNKMIDSIEQSYRKIATNEREGAWREMARQVAHEIKNPLTPMKLKIQMLQRAIALNEPNIEHRTLVTLQTLLTQIDLLSRIATEFSDFAKFNEGTPVRCDLRVIMLGVYELFQHNKNIELTLDSSMDAPLYIMADEQLISQVFVNLCKNAIQATDSRKIGIINISIHSLENNMVRIDIQDNGEGIPETIQGHIFEPNFTTKSSGSGLGLAISAQIIRNLNGHITFVSDTECGTTFSVTLPLSSMF